DAVRELRRDTGLPGMSILQFAFGGDSDNYYLPHNLQHNSVVYPGTHDNNTSLGWYRKADKKTQDHVRRYYRINGSEIGWDLIRSSYRSVSRLAIVQLQDLMSLDDSARFNTPGEAVGNWEWRYTPKQLRVLTGPTADYLKSLSQIYYRDNQPAVNII
ncbi:MAG: 4-alpha-glucanotransferase, partial [Verrucomicrobiota bacterium]